jgi:hypothetical protein
VAEYFEVAYLEVAVYETEESEFATEVNQFHHFGYFQV